MPGALQATGRRRSACATRAGAPTRQTFASRSEAYFSPKLSLQWKPAADWTLRSSLARAYRLPTVAELFQGSIPNTQNTVNYNNPDLRPERVTSAELNAEHEFRIGQASGWVRGTAFYEGNRDALIRQPVPPTDPNFNLATGTATFWSNVEFVRSRGVELAWHAQDAGLRGLDVDGSLTYAHSLIVEDKAQPTYVDNWQNRVPKWRARLLGSYRASEAWSIAAGGRYSGLQRNGYPNADIRPNTYLGFAPYLVFDARATWKPLKQLTVAAGVDNLTNRLYYQFHPYPRRTFNLELRYDY
jgi:iron complex outermembrane receptor protein